MTFLLDTMVWVWLCQRPDIIPERVLDSLRKTDERWGLSAVSPWEVARKVSLFNKKPGHPAALNLGLPFSEWFEKAWDEADYSILPLTPQIAAESNNLPGRFHHDPMDQIIIATARRHDLTLVTSDRLIKAYPHVRKLCFTPKSEPENRNH